MKPILNLKNGPRTVAKGDDFRRVGFRHQHRLLTLIAGLALTPNFWPNAWAQTTPAPETYKLRTKPTQPAELPPSPQAVSPPIPAPQAPPPEQLPARPPEITWDGKQLSIKSENSTLADILAAVRSRIKTDIEIPAGAAAERVAADLGPGPAREVLTSLLGGSNFDYIIQASDSDENTIQSVLLMPRGESDNGLGATEVASARSRPMPGYSGPMRRRPEPMGETGTDRSSVDTPPASEVAAAEAGPAAETPASKGELASSQAGPASPTEDAVTGDTGKAGTDQIASAADASAPPAADASSTSFSMPQMADLQKMYEQRRQLQIQQNQAGAAPPANAQ